jgi:F-type H+-transporting ATPase subunit epsilon|uniref:ATP synthase epsilon chain, chloroplastic n=1 Tax=Chloropicon roscoffensis TaxID=1461544 RepID=A0A4D6C4C3_9CHLO|nr:CF1 epsilon subunit of ATP synthase [Chloropicon roscoffensis]|tara:strand:- start:1268 stop:1672 length:405 start_codon:yes stop_codon:yes gene_type:complete|mmetsp:Transcript_2100/g.6993  ORF Transcript_2100/g.6993 Transcript_2100/m.6993 type:complete len:135 (+) Transcript_2100:1743-2147(+)
MALKVSLITPDCILWDGPVEEALLSTTTGLMGILPNHAPLLTALEIGPLRLRNENKEWLSFAVMGGFATIKDNALTLIVNQAESGTSLEKATVEENLSKAKAALEEASTPADLIEAQIAYRKAKARFEATLPKS